MTRDQAFIHACDEANKSRALTETEVDGLCAVFERDARQELLAARRAARAARIAGDPVYAHRLAQQRERYRRDPAFRARQIAAAKARYYARKRAQA